MHLNMIKSNKKRNDGGLVTDAKGVKPILWWMEMWAVFTSGTTKNMSIKNGRRIIFSELIINIPMILNEKAGSGEYIIDKVLDLKFW